MDIKYIRVFPDYFNTTAVSDIHSNGTKDSIEVYRVSKYGNNNEEAFLNYYDEVIRGFKLVRPKDKEKTLRNYSNNMKYLSISCYYNKEDINDYFNYTLKDTHPERALLKGVTCPACGLSQKTAERDDKCKDSHTDWWLYKDSKPWLVFKEVQS